MRRPLQTVLLLLSGAGLLRIALFGDLYLRYVKEGMRPLLIGSGVLLILLGLTDAVSSLRRREDGGHTGHGDGGHGHQHSSVPRPAWLLFLPALSLLLYAPPALGAYTASREPAEVAVTHEDDFDPLPATSPLPITLSDFTRRVRQDRTGAIGGRTVRMTGFVTSAGQGGGWFLTRIMISCCAADARSVKVRVHGAPAPAADTWVTVTGAWHPGGTLGTGSAPAALDARSVEKTAEPVNAYTDALPPPALGR
ncbi:TIGR03943 family protein [Streptomyces sp. NPDC006967]|uniref:TIGR03943 family putative permease subunit n=1 Tax=unclassified Streptomyces TaxID=2593676 RepID=UPI000CD56D2F|nr:TIGR03943 family protein [Streptomyces sp. SM1]